MRSRRRKQYEHRNIRAETDETHLEGPDQVLDRPSVDTSGGRWLFQARRYF